MTMKSALLGVAITYIGVVVSYQAYPAKADEAAFVVHLPGYQRGKPPCRVQFPRASADCKGDICTLPAMHGPAQPMLALNLSCAPMWARYSFEYPDPGVEIHRINTANALLYYKFHDGPSADAGESRNPPLVRRLDFCLTRMHVNFCGDVEVRSLQDEHAVDGTDQVLQFLKSAVVLADGHD